MSEKSCAYCGESIRAEAIKCRYCGSRVSFRVLPVDRWHRDHAGRKLAGVCVSIAHHADLPVTAVRVGFLLLCLFHGLGLWLYAGLWFLIPARRGSPSGWNRLVRAWHVLLGDDLERAPAPPPAADSRRDGSQGNGGDPARMSGVGPDPAVSPTSGAEGSPGTWNPTRS